MNSLDELKEACERYREYGRKHFPCDAKIDLGDAIADALLDRSPISMDFWSSLKPTIPPDARAFMHLHLGDKPDSPILWAMQKDVDSFGIIKTVSVSALSCGMEGLKRPLFPQPKTIGQLMFLLLSLGDSE